MKIMRFVTRLIESDAPAATLLIRVMVGGIFFSEGIQKFLNPAMRGAGRFVKIGIPAPEIMGPFVGGLEIICGMFLLLGILTRLSAIPLIINMIVAIVTTKLPIVMGHGLWGFSLKKLSIYGWWSMAHEARTDFAMLLGSLFLFWVGSGRYSLDWRWSRAHNFEKK